MRNKFLFIYLLLTCVTTQAQNVFEKTYGSSGVRVSASACKQTFDGGYIIAGGNYSTADTGNVYLQKIDSAGNILWTNTFGGVRPDGGTSIDETNDKGFIIVGATQSFGANLYLDIYLNKTDSSGNLLWSKTYTSPGMKEIDEIRQTKDGGFIMVGWCNTQPYDSLHWHTHVYLIKTDANGNLLWTKTYGDYATWCRGNSVQETNDKGFIIGGYAQTPTNNQDAYLLKTDSLGNLIWTRNFGSPYGEDDMGAHGSVQQTNDGGYIVTGRTQRVQGSNNAVFLVKMNSAGNILWSKVYGGFLASNPDEGGYLVRQTKDRGFAIIGNTQNSFNQKAQDIYLIKTDSSGQLLWSKLFGDSLDDFPRSIEETADKGLIIVGSREVQIGLGYPFNIIYIIKTDSLGNTSCSQSNPPTQTQTFTLTGPNLPMPNDSTIGTMAVPPTATYTFVTPPTVDCSSLVVIKQFNLSRELIQVYPNPTSNTISFNIENISDFQNSIITIQNTLGQTVKKIPFSNTIDVSTLSEGCYFLQITSSNGETYKTKFIKQ